MGCHFGMQNKIQQSKKKQQNQPKQKHHRVAETFPRGRGLLPHSPQPAHFPVSISPATQASSVWGFLVSTTTQASYPNSPPQPRGSARLGDPRRNRRPRVSRARAAGASPELPRVGEPARPPRKLTPQRSSAPPSLTAPAAPGRRLGPGSRWSAPAPKQQRTKALGRKRAPLPRRASRGPGPTPWRAGPLPLPGARSDLESCSRPPERGRPHLLAAFPSRPKRRTEESASLLSLVPGCSLRRRGGRAAGPGRGGAQAGRPEPGRRTWSCSRSPLPGHKEQLIRELRFPRRALELPPFSGQSGRAPFPPRGGVGGSPHLGRRRR